MANGKYNTKMQPITYYGLPMPRSGRKGKVYLNHEAFQIVNDGNPYVQNEVDRLRVNKRDK